MFSVLDCQYYTFIFPWYIKISDLEYDIAIVHNSYAWTFLAVNWRKMLETTMYRFYLRFRL